MANMKPQNQHASTKFGLLALWRNQKTRSVIFQILAMSILFASVAYFITNAISNLQDQGQDFSYAYLNYPAGYDISQRLIDYSSSSTHLRAMFVGILNTLLVAVIGIVFATILGFLIGVMRLSKNWLIAKISYVYVEVIRNVPILLQILLWNGIFLSILPNPKAAFSLADLFYLSNRGLAMPRPSTEPLFIIVTIAFFAGIAFTIWFRRYAKKVQDETGKILPVFLTAIGAIIIVPVILFFILGAPIIWDIPELTRFNFKGGMTVIPQFVSLTLALSLYTAAFIAEIVRAGIVAVPHGQTEAASSLGNKPNRTLQLIIIPQALRVIIPPLASQYLNLTKNSSLAIAVGYQDIVGTIGGTTLNQTGRAMESMIIVLLLYLSFSLIISAFMNWYNKRIKLVER